MQDLIDEIDKKNSLADMICDCTPQNKVRYDIEFYDSNEDMVAL